MTDFALKTWENAIDGIAKAFLKKYFPEEVNKERAYWCGDEIGGVFCVAYNCFFDSDFMLKALQLNATFEQVSGYYDAQSDYHGEDPDICPPFMSLEYYMKHGATPTPVLSEAVA
jgi:hypothetical protein